MRRDRGHWLDRLAQSPPLRVSLLVVVGLAVLHRILQVLIGSEGPAWGYDFAAYWLAAERVLAGEPLYWEAQLRGPFPPQVTFAYLYPPLLAVLVTPLRLLFPDYQTAMLAWAAGGIALLVLSVAALVYRHRLPGIAAVLLVGAGLALAGTAQELIMGNVHLLLLGLLTAAWLSFALGRPVGDMLGGALVGLAAVIKVFPLILVLWLLLRRNYLAAASACVSVILLVGVTLPIVGLQPWLDFPVTLGNLGAPMQLWSSIAPTAVLTEFVGFPAARVGVTLLGLTVIVWSTLRQPAPISYGVAVMVSFLVAPTIYLHYLALAILPLTLLAIYSRTWILPGVAYFMAVPGLTYAELILGVAPGLEEPLVRGVVIVGALAPLGALLITGSGSDAAADVEPAPQAA